MRKRRSKWGNAAKKALAPGSASHKSKTFLAGTAVANWEFQVCSFRGSCACLEAKAASMGMTCLLESNRAAEQAAPLAGVDQVPRQGKGGRNPSRHQRPRRRGGLSTGALAPQKKNRSACTRLSAPRRRPLCAVKQPRTLSSKISKACCWGASGADRTLCKAAKASIVPEQP